MRDRRGDRRDRDNRNGGGGRREGRGRDRDHDGDRRDDEHGRSKVDRNPNPRPDGERSRSRERRERDRRREREREREERSRSRDREESPVPIIQRRRKSGWDQIVPITEDIVVPIAQPPNPFQNPQLMKQQKKLYVGNLPANVTEIEILEFFNSAMLNANATTSSGSPIVSALLNSEKAYAFLEFRSLEEATAGMNLDGLTFRGQPLRVRRPKDWAPLPEGALEAPANANIGIVSTNVADTPNKIFIGGLPPHLNEGDIKKLLSMFGQLKSFNLVRDSLTGLSKGFAFCEYGDPSITDTACASLNGMAIGDKSLIVQRASTNTKKPDGASGPLNPRAALMLTLSTPAAQLLATAVKNATAEPTKILVIMNILNLLDFPGDHVESEYQEVCDDIRIECERYGTVVKIVIPRPNKKNTHHTIEHFDAIKWDDIGKDSDDEEEKAKEAKPEIPDPPGLGKVFVEYAEVEHAKHAQTALSGRRFDGRMVVTSFHPEDKWNAGNLELDDIDDMTKHEQQKLQMLKEQKEQEKQAEQNAEIKTEPQQQQH